jgi:hypothetical protein
MLVVQSITHAARIAKRSAPLQADDVARHLLSLNPSYFRAATRTRYYCNYAPQGETEAFVFSRAFETIEKARAHARELVQQGFDGRIEKHYEWRNLVYGPRWHRDDYDPNAIEIIEDFLKAS